MEEKKLQIWMKKIFVNAFLNEVFHPSLLSDIRSLMLSSYVTLSISLFIFPHIFSTIITPGSKDYLATTLHYLEEVTTITCEQK